MDPLKQTYMRALVRMVKLTRSHPLLIRLATSQSTLHNIQQLHLELDAIADNYNVTALPSWRDDWEDACAELRNNLMTRTSNCRERMLVNEVRADKVEEVLRDLHASLSATEPPEFVQFKTEIYHNIRRFSQLEGLEMFSWFIPRGNITVDDEKSIGSGTFGDVRQGTWLLPNGSTRPVVVKQLFQEISNASASADLFLEQLLFWTKLPDDAHILKVYGAVHIGDPKQYVCESALNGNLMTFLGEEKNKLLFWPMFLQVVEGLKTLHARNVIHGGLKCFNVLVGADNTAKLSDFGFSFIRSLSIALSDNKNKAMNEAVRWKPKEMLEETLTSDPCFASDVYSLGISMIEAITQEIPFGMASDDEVVDKITRGEGHPRPDGVSDAAWRL